jgi:site-specific recombinase XerD
MEITKTKIEIKTGGSPLSFEGFLAKYSKTTKGLVKSHLSGFFTFMALNGWALSDTNQDIINIYMNELKQSGIKNATYNTKISYLKSFFTHHGLKFEFKQAKVRAYNNTKIIGYDEFKNVINYLSKMKEIETPKQAKYLRDYIVFSLLFTTGLRKNEVLSIKHSDIKIEGSQFFVSVVAKGNQERAKEIVPAIMDDIERLKEIEKKSNEDLVFTSHAHNKDNQRNKLSNKALNKVINSYYQKINKTKETVTIHSIRNQSGIKYYEEMKGDILAVQDHLGHANIATTERYLRAVKTKKSDTSQVLYNLIG